MEPPSEEFPNDVPAAYGDFVAYEVLLREWKVVTNFLLREGFERVYVTNDTNFRNSLSQCFAFLRFGSKSKADEVAARFPASENSLDRLCETLCSAYSAKVSMHQPVCRDPKRPSEVSVRTFSAPVASGEETSHYHFLLDLKGRLSCLIRSEVPAEHWNPARLKSARKRLAHLKSAFDEAKRALKPDSMWMEKYFDQLLALWQQADATVRLAAEGPIIGVVGASRLGKSALINVLLQCKLMPVEAGDITTAAATSVAYKEEADFVCTFTLESADSLVRMLDDYKLCKSVLASLLKKKKANGAKDDDEDEDEENPLSSEQLDAEIKRTEAEIDVYKGRLVSLTTETHLESLVGKKPSKAAAQRWLQVLNLARDANEKAIVKETDIQKLGELIKPYLSSVANKKKGDDIPLWPLVRHAHITGRFYILQSGCVLLDLPGITDTNAARRQLAAKYLGQCSAAFVLGNPENSHDPSLQSILSTISDVNRDLLRNMTIVVPQCISKMDPGDLRSVWEQHCDGPEDDISIGKRCRMYIVSRIANYEKALLASQFPECRLAPIVAIDAYEAANGEGKLRDVLGKGRASDLANKLNRLPNPRENQLGSLRSFMHQCAFSRTWYLNDLEAQIELIHSQATDLTANGPLQVLERNEENEKIFESFKNFLAQNIDDATKEISNLFRTYTANINAAPAQAQRATSNFFHSLRRSMWWNTFLAFAARNGVFKNDDWNRTMFDHLSSGAASISTGPTRTQALAAIFRWMTSLIQRFEAHVKLAGVPQPVLNPLLQQLERQREICRNSIPSSTWVGQLVGTMQRLAIPGYIGICNVDRGPGRFDRMISASMTLCQTHANLIQGLNNEAMQLEKVFTSTLRTFSQFMTSCFDNLFGEISSEVRFHFVNMDVIKQLARALERDLNDFVFDEQDMEDILKKMVSVHIKKDSDEQMDASGVPYRFLCPVSLQLMLWPIRANDGLIYDASSLNEMISADMMYSLHDPTIVLDPQQLKLDESLRDEILAWLESTAGKRFLVSDEGIEYLQLRKNNPKSPF